MAVPGPVRSPASAGTNQLLAEARAGRGGPRRHRRAGGPRPRAGLAAHGGRASARRPARSTPGSSTAMGWQPATLDQLVLRTGLAHRPRWPAGLVRLELDGWVAQRGGWYERSGQARWLSRREPTFRRVRRPVPWAPMASDPWQPPRVRGVAARGGSANTVAAYRPRPGRLHRVGRAPRHRTTRPASTARSCAATSPTWPPAATPGAPSPARRPTLRRYFGWLRRIGQRAGRPRRPACRPRPGRAACPGCCATTSSARCSTSPRPRSTTTRPAVRLRDDAVLEILYGSGLRVAELCGLRPDDLDARPAAGPGVGQGLQAAPGPAQRPGRRRPRRLAARTAVEALVTDQTHRPTPSSSTGGVGASRPATSGASSTAAPRRPPTPTPCATPSPPTCSTGAPTCVPCRSCSATATWPPHSTTLTCPRSGCGAFCTLPIPEPRKPPLDDDAAEHTERLWSDYKSSGRPSRPRAADPALLAAGQVRRGPRRGRACRRTSSRAIWSATASSG